MVCVTFVKTLIFAGIQRVKTGLFYKSSSQSLIDSWFMYYVMEHWIIPRRNYLVAVIHDICFFPITWMRCPFYGKFVYCLANILLMAYHTSRHITRIVTRKFSMGGLYICSGGLTFCSLIKTSPISSASQFNLWAWRFVWGAWPPKAPRGDGTAHNYHSLYILGLVQW